jgi:hypothetical protein
MSKKNEVIVYWCPANYAPGTDAPPTWNLLYKEPEVLFTELTRKRNLSHPDPGTSMLICPAVSSVSKNTLVFTVPSSCSYSYTTDSEGILTSEPLTDVFMALKQVRNPSLNYGPSISTPLKVLLFAEEPLVVRLTSPYFHEPKHMKYGASVFGEYDIGQWFRIINWELQMWEKEGVLSFEEGEPAFYLEFKTDKKIVFKKVKFTEEVRNVSTECGLSPMYLGRFLPLAKRYQRFKEAGMRDRLLSELRANVIKEQ